MIKWKKFGRLVDVEIAKSRQAVFIRNTSSPDEILVFSREDWEEFKKILREGE